MQEYFITLVFNTSISKMRHLTYLPLYKFKILLMISLTIHIKYEMNFYVSMTASPKVFLVDVAGWLINTPTVQ